MLYLCGIFDLGTNENIHLYTLSLGTFPKLTSNQLLVLAFRRMIVRQKGLDDSPIEDVEPCRASLVAGRAGPQLFTGQLGALLVEGILPYLYKEVALLRCGQGN